MESSYKDIAKVAGVVDGLKFVINRGSKHGVENSQNFLIFHLGDVITDPDSGEELGSLELVRGRARVVHVQEQISTLESIEKKTTPGKVRKIKRGTRGHWLAQLAGPSEEEIEEGSETHIVGLNVEIGDMARPI